MQTLTLIVIFTHVIAFLTGYLLCLYNSKTEENIWKHGIRPQPQVEEN